MDLFEDQHLNIDLSGSGDLAKFHRNLLRHANDARLVLHQGNSLELAGADLVRLAEGPLGPGRRRHTGRTLRRGLMRREDF